MPMPAMGVMSWIVVIVIVIGCFAVYSLFDYAAKVGFNDESPEQKKEKDERVVRILSRKVKEDQDKK